MTGPAQRIPHRRASDQGRLGRFRSWWTEWGQLIMGAWLLVVSIVVLWVAVGFWQSQRDTARAARVSCERSKAFGPRVADDYEKRGVFTRRELDDYRSSIPRRCPDQ
jgi:hypothetical protein